MKAMIYYFEGHLHARSIVSDVHNSSGSLRSYIDFKDVRQKKNGVRICKMESATSSRKLFRKRTRVNVALQPSCRKAIAPFAVYGFEARRDVNTDKSEEKAQWCLVCQSSSRRMSPDVERPSIRKKRRRPFVLFN